MGLIFVNSIISSHFNKRMESFREEIDTYILNNSENELDSLPALPVFGLRRNNLLEDIGTPDEDPDDFIALIEQNMSGDYNELFEKMVRQIDDLTTSDECQTDGLPEKWES